MFFNISFFLLKEKEFFCILNRGQTRRSPQRLHMLKRFDFVIDFFEINKRSLTYTTVGATSVSALYSHKKIFINSNNKIPFISGQCVIVPKPTISGFSFLKRNLDFKNSKISKIISFQKPEK